MNVMSYGALALVHMRTLKANIGNRRVLCHCAGMIRSIAAFALLALTAACATAVPYGPAAKDGAKGYMVQPIESNRFRVSYRDGDAETARTRALRRAAEITRENGAEWFQVVGAYDDTEHSSGRSGASVSIGGGTGSYGRSSVGVGLGIGFPLGGSSKPVTHVLEIITDSGDKPEGAQTYDADAVLMNLAGQ